jgi:hypothetical protein
VVDPGTLTVTFLRSSAPAVGAVLLCDIHQRRVAVPEGWVVRDERVPADEIVPADDIVRLDEIVLADETVLADQTVLADETVPDDDRAPVTASASLVDDAESRPLLRRAFRAAAPGSALAREPRGLSWLERLHQEVDGSPQHAAHGMDDDGQHDRDADGHDQDGHDRHVGRRDDHADGDRAHERGDGDDRVHPDSADEVTFLALEDEPAPGTMVGHLQPMSEDLALTTDGAAHEEGSSEELPPTRRRRGSGHSPQRMDNLSLFSDLADVALGA